MLANKLNLRNFEQRSIRERIELVEDHHTIRGTPFRGVVNALDKYCGTDAAPPLCDKFGLPTTFELTARYPMREFLLFEQAAAEAITKVNGGDFDMAIAECGAGAVDLFFGSRAGEVMRGLSGRSPHRMLSSVPVGYQVLVNFGERSWKKINAQAGVFKFRGELLGIMHSWGVFDTSLTESYGKNVRYKLDILGPLDFDLRLDW